MNNDIQNFLKKYSSPLDPNEKILSIILAAGHGKRIKSETSKMLHTIWNKPSVMRVSDTVKEGLGSKNQIIVVGTKAREVITTLDKQECTTFVYQSQQKGTGHAAKIALDHIENIENLEAIFVLPGDLGLITAEEIRTIKENFFNSGNDMIIMTGTYKGNPENNYYGRVVRVPSKDNKGNQSPNTGEVIAIVEFKDIINLDDEKGLILNHRDRNYHFSKKQLLEIPEFNAGVYGFKAKSLIENISKIKSNNIQKEIYLTDLVSILNQNGHRIGISKAHDNESILGFNIKSVLRTMEAIARRQVYDKLKDIITIVDEEDFFIADEVVDRLLEMDTQGEAVDIVIGTGVHLGKDVHLKKGVKIEKNSRIEGEVYIGEYSYIGSACSMDNYAGQKIVIGRHCQLLTGTVIRGNVTLGNYVRIESGVRVTGNSDYSAVIEDKVLIKGTTYIFGSYVESEVEIEHSILKRKRIERIEKKDGTIQAIRYCLPLPEGLDSLSDL